MRLCVGVHPHTNPDGSVIAGSYLHAYYEGFDDRIAIPTTIDSQDFINETLLLLKTLQCGEGPATD